MPMISRFVTRLVPMGVTLSVVCALASPVPAHAADVVGKYPAWTIDAGSSSAPNHNGAIIFNSDAVGKPKVLGMPNATYTVTKSRSDGQATTLKDATTPPQEWLTAATPFGALFGATNTPTSIEYLSVRVDYNANPALNTIATTAVDFESPVPANAFGFAVGDIDVDQVVVSGTDASNAAISGTAFAAQKFNFCDVTTDKPPACGAPPYTEPNLTTGATSVSVVGSTPGDETTGPTAWFRPMTRVKSLQFVFQGQAGAGAPSYRLWMAVLTATVRGIVDFGTCPTREAEVQLVAHDGTTVLATATTAADGSYSFASVLSQPGYEVRLSSPQDCQPVGEAEKPADITDKDVTVDFRLEETPAATPAGDLTEGGTIIANTGSGTAIEAGVGGAMTLLGALFIYLARRRRTVEA